MLHVSYLICHLMCICFLNRVSVEINIRYCNVSMRLTFGPMAHPLEFLIEPSGGRVSTPGRTLLLLRFLVVNHPHKFTSVRIRNNN
jgi:hypothetical protein